jgi:hypothetical protein
MSEANKPTDEVKHECRTKCVYTDGKEKLKLADNKMEQRKKKELYSYEELKK